MKAQRLTLWKLYGALADISTLRDSVLEFREEAESEAARLTSRLRALENETLRLTKQLESRHGVLAN